MRGERVRWILAFDSGCARCRALANSVSEACQGGLEILPLDHSDVQRWAGQARPGRPMAWTPALFRLRGTSVRMWTGRALSARLVLHLGPRASGRVLHVLAAAPNVPSAAVSTGTAVNTSPGSTTRRRFLELTGGAAIAAGIIITGAIPAVADPVDTWLRTNRQKLPRTYAELVVLPLEFRSAAYQELTAAERSAAWVAHLTSNRAPTLTTEQSAVLAAALALAANPGNFSNGGPAAAAAVSIAGRATAAFGVDRAREIFATLGPSGAPAAIESAAITTTAVRTTALASCQCSTSSDYCGGHCQSGGCTSRSPGCGFLYQYACNGHCV